MTILNFRTRIEDPLAEGVSPHLTATLTDEAGAALPSAMLDTLTLTLYALASGEVLNSRDRVNILNANGGTVDADGKLEWQGEPDDTALETGEDGAAVLRVFLIEWTWAGGTRAGRHEVLFEIRNLGQVPAPAP